MKIVDLLGGEAEYYLNHTCKTIDKQLIHIPGPDMIDKKRKNSDRNISVKITEGANIKSSGSMYLTDHLKEDDKYPVFIDGNHALTEITNTNAKNGTILLI